MATAVGEGDAARLWIDGVVIVDGFKRGLNGADWEGADEGLGGGGTGYVNLTAGHLHDIFIEYRYATVGRLSQHGDGRCATLGVRST